MKLELLTSDEQRKLCKAFEALQADATVLETEIQQLQEAHEKTIEAIASAHESRRTAVRTGNEALRLEAMEQIRSLADIVLPAHDPLTLERWPDGMIGACPSP